MHLKFRLIIYGYYNRYKDEYKIPIIKSKLMNIPSSMFEKERFSDYNNTRFIIISIVSTIMHLMVITTMFISLILTDYDNYDKLKTEKSISLLVLTAMVIIVSFLLWNCCATEFWNCCTKKFWTCCTIFCCGYISLIMTLLIAAAAGHNTFNVCKTIVEVIALVVWWFALACSGIACNCKQGLLIGSFSQ